MSNKNFAKFFAQNLSQNTNPRDFNFAYNLLSEDEISKIWNGFQESLMQIYARYCVEYTTQPMSELTKLLRHEISLEILQQHIVRCACFYLSEQWLRITKLQSMFEVE